MLDLGGSKMLVVLLVALVVLGPQELPKLVRKYGKVMAELRRLSGSFHAQIDDVVRDPLSAFTSEVKDSMRVSHDNPPPNGSTTANQPEPDATDPPSASPSAGLVERTGPSGTSAA